MRAETDELTMVIMNSGTLLNKHPSTSGHPRYNGQFWKSRLFFHILQYFSHTILDDPDSVDTRRPFQQDRCCNYQLDL